MIIITNTSNVNRAVIMIESKHQYYNITIASCMYAQLKIQLKVVQCLSSRWLCEVLRRATFSSKMVHCLIDTISSQLSASYYMLKKTTYSKNVTHLILIQYTQPSPDHSSNSASHSGTVAFPEWMIKICTHHSLDEGAGGSAKQSQTHCYISSCYEALSHHHAYISLLPLVAI